MSSKKICILIPAFNEERTISEVISKIPKIPNHLTTILVVDDGSQDNTKKIAEKMGAVVISNRKNAGLGYTFKRGLRYAIKMGADIIVILDADGQYDPVEIKRFVKVLYENKGDIIVGNRILSSSVINYGIMRKWMNFLISFFISKILLKNKFIFDTQTSFRVFNKRVAQF
ncbi:MAG: glycosyltransferase family 2 protein, partial [Promethearchaeota archaeon]